MKEGKKNVEKKPTPRITKYDKLFRVNPQEIIVETSRYRKLFSEKALENLAQSIRQIGQLQPGICILKNKKLYLVVGERRLRACKKLEITFTYVLTTLEDVRDLQQAQMEENLKRESLTWQEEVREKSDLSELFKAKNPKTTIRSMAEYLGEAKSLFNEDVQLAAWVDEIPEVNIAPNKTVAKKIVKRLTETIKRQNKLETINKNQNSSSTVDLFGLVKEEQTPETLETSETEIPYSGTSNSLTSTEPEIVNTADTQAGQEEKRQEAQTSVIPYYKEHCLLGDFEELAPQLSSSIFDIVFFDPPWGVDYSEARSNKLSQRKYSDDSWDFWSNFKIWVDTLYRLMTTNSHLYCFFAIREHKFVYDTLENAGFKVDRIPLIWYKTGQHVTRTPKTTYGRAYEPIAFARKGVKPLRAPTANFLETLKAPKVLSEVHPTAKNPEIYLKLLQASADVGDKILDPMSGTGAMGLAAETLRQELKLEWLMIEEQPEFNILQKSLLSDGYYQVQKSKEEEESENEEENKKENPNAC